MLFNWVVQPLLQRPALLTPCVSQRSQVLAAEEQQVKSQADRGWLAQHQLV